MSAPGVLCDHRLLHYGAMTFYHFTSEEALHGIESHGLILPTESNVGSVSENMPPMGEGLGPDVVWLIDSPDRPANNRNKINHGLFGTLGDKTAVRIEVEVPAIRWYDWAPAQQMNPTWKELLITASGGPAASDHWYVFPAPIPRSRWVRVERLDA